MILAIDPGNIESGYVFTNDDLSIVDKGKIKNEELLAMIKLGKFKYINLDEGKITKFKTNIAIEMIASYGMPVGVEVFETCVWIGRFKESLINSGYISKDEEIKYIYRKDEKMNLCHSMKANDTTIKQTLVDRFTPGAKNYGKGTKKNPGWFHGFKSDIWQAYAVAVTYYDLYIEVQNEG